MKSVFDQAIKPDTIDDAQGVNLFLTGSPGAGKTAFIGSAADTFPNQVLLLDCNGGMRTLADRGDIDVIPVENWNTISKDVFEALAEGDHNYKVVAIDLVSEAYQILIKQITKEGYSTKSSRPTLEGYGIANTRFIEMIRNYRWLSTTAGIHVIFTSHSTESKDEITGGILVRANLTPGTLATVIGTVDVAGFLEIKRKKRIMHLVGNDRIWAKARVPLSWGAVPETFDNPTFERLVAILRGESIE